MTQSYSEHFTPIRKRLESLKGAIDQDLPGLETAALDLTFRQVIDLTTGLDSTMQAYTSAMQPYYRVTRKSKGASGQGSSYYQRRREREEHVANLAYEAIQKQGHVIAASIVTETGYRENSVLKTLEQLAAQNYWDKKRDRETKSYKYTPRTSSPTEASGGPSPS